MMTSTGTLTLGALPPYGCYASDGTFVLLLLAYDRLDHGTKTAYSLIWCGPQAAQFHQAHKDTLAPGARLQVTLGRIWLLRDRHANTVAAHATVLEMTLSGHAQSITPEQAVAA